MVTVSAVAAMPVGRGEPVRLTSAGEAVPTMPINLTGIQPTEFKVLIEPDTSEKVTKGGIIKPDVTVDSEKFGAIEGRIIAVSPLAFSYATADDWKAAGAQKPAAGDRVLYAKYAGVRHKGRDGKEYLLVNDKDIVATIED